MRALIAVEPGRLVIGDADEPALVSRSMRVRTAVSAVSPGSELRSLFDPTRRFPRVGGTGYMGAGTVIDVASDVQEFAPGDRIMFSTNDPVSPHVEICRVRPETAVRLPATMPSVRGACSYWGVPPYRGILNSGLRFYDDAAVVGLGPLGLCAVQMLRRTTRRLIAVDPVAMRRELATEFGVDAALDPTEATWLDESRQTIPAGPPVVFEISGTQEGLDAAIRLCGPRGAVVQVGVLPPLNAFQMFRPMQDKGVRFVPIYREADSIQDRVGDNNARYMANVVDMIDRGYLNIDRLVTWVAPWTSGPELIPKLRDARETAIGLALVWAEADEVPQSRA